jgi:glutaconate CoA-transferase subunit B
MFTMSDEIDQLKYSSDELLAVMISRLLDDRDSVAAGAHTGICFGGTLLAQKTHAPNLKLQLGTSCYLCNVVDQSIEKLPESSSAPHIAKWAEELHTPPDVFFYRNEPKDGDGANKFWVGDKFFVSGLQVDKYGAVNLLGLGDGDTTEFRGPGSIALPDLTTISHIIIFLRRHDARTLVEEVDLVSLPGRREFERNRYPGGGPSAILTPLAIFDFAPNSQRARIRATMPGVTLEEVTERTGFDPIVPDDLTEVDPPTAEELECLRTEVDPTGTLD